MLRPKRHISHPTSKPPAVSSMEWLPMVQPLSTHHTSLHYPLRPQYSCTTHIPPGPILLNIHHKPTHVCRISRLSDVGVASFYRFMRKGARVRIRPWLFSFAFLSLCGHFPFTTLSKLISRSLLAIMCEMTARENQFHAEGWSNLEQTCVITAACVLTLRMC